MHVAFPIANERRKSKDAECSGLKLAVRQFFQPCVLAFLALAVAVGGWGYGYKLSRYLDNSHVPKASATRMFVEHRDDVFTTPSQHRTRPGKPIVSQHFACSVPRVPHVSRDLVFASSAPSRLTIFISSLNPLRAPPTIPSSLA